MNAIRGAEGFDWDEGNESKNWTKHRVSRSECEEVFFNRPLVFSEDVAHSNDEDRYLVLGQTDQGRRLFVVFVMRRNLLRVISARDMTPRERRAYEGSMADEYEDDSQV
jgi:uncharacterized protein